MSNYHGRSGPNFSQFLNNLNTVSPYESELIPADEISIDQDLALFTNADFTDFGDLGSMPNNNELNFDMNNEHQPELKFEGVIPNAAPSFLQNYGTPIQPAPQQASFAHQAGSVSPADSPSQVSNKQSLKRKQDSITLSLEDQTRMAAEEDKRRRNTAASARFRVKKKQREQALERTVKEVNDKNAVLQARVDQLEMENKWLKNLVMEKNDSETEKDIADMYQKFRREGAAGDSKGPERKDGVGTQ